MPADDDVALVRAVFAAFAARDIDAALPLMTADVRLELETTGRFAGRHEPYVGHDGARDYFGDLIRVWDKVELIPEVWETAGERVVVHGRARAQIGTQELHARIRWEWTIRDGLIAGIRQTMALDQ